MYNMDEIVERLGLTGEREAALHVTLLRELALGQPVTVERLAKSLNWTTDEAELVLEKLPCGTIEYDGQGRLIGSGITLRETPHAFVLVCTGCLDVSSCHRRTGAGAIALPADEQPGHLDGYATGSGFA